MKLSLLSRFCLGIAIPLSMVGCGSVNSDSLQRQQQETILQEATSQTGMPAMVNFFERKMLKRIIEYRDKPNYITYTYVRSQINGELKFLCKSIGYGIPYATQYTNPQKPATHYGESVVLPQADPNGLFSPSSADATWVLCVNPQGGEPDVIYEESRITVSPRPLH